MGSKKKKRRQKNQAKNKKVVPEPDAGMRRTSINLSLADPEQGGAPMALPFNPTPEIWGALAANAWDGYQTHGRGAVQIDLRSVPRDAPFNVEITYLPAGDPDLREGLIGSQAFQWLQEYDPERGIFLRIQIGRGFGYFQLYPPNALYLPPPKAYAEERAKMLESYDFHHSMMVRHWSEFAAIAWEGYTAAGRGIVYIDLSETLAPLRDLSMVNNYKAIPQLKEGGLYMGDLIGSVESYEPETSFILFVQVMNDHRVITTAEAQLDLPRPPAAFEQQARKSGPNSRMVS